MKLPLCLAFALLLAFHSHGSVSAQSQGDPDQTFSGDGEEVKPSTQTRSNEGLNDDFSPLTPSPHEFSTSIDLSETPEITNETSILESNTSSPVTPTQTTQIGLNSTDYVEPQNNSTDFEIVPTNETISDTFQGPQNSTSAPVNVTSTTTLSPNVTGTTESLTGPAENTSTKTTKLPSTVESTTPQTTKLNSSGGLFDVRGNSERGVASDIKENKNGQAWGAILGIAITVGIIALVVYVVMKRRNYRDFSHRKLVEEMPSDPVLRLDNNEPLDLNFGGLAYYNPGLQGDNIQMTNFPQGHNK